MLVPGACTIPVRALGSNGSGMRVDLAHQIHFVNSRTTTLPSLFVTRKLVISDALATY